MGVVLARWKGRGAARGGVPELELWDEGRGRGKGLCYHAVGGWKVPVRSVDISAAKVGSWEQQKQAPAL